MAHVPTLVCFCGAEMKCEKIGVILEAELPDQDDRPYWKASVDLWGCVDCETKVFRTTNRTLVEPWDKEGWEHWKSDYQAKIRG